MTDFRTLDDFTVRLIDTDDSGKQIEYASSGERLAGFPAWEHADRDLRHFINSDIPIGTRDEPYEDREGTWQIAIFEHGGWVFIAERHGKQTTAFRVRTDRYIDAWKALIDRFNPEVVLDDLFDQTELE